MATLILRRSFAKKKLFIAVKLLSWFDPLFRLGARLITGKPSASIANCKKIIIMGDHHIGDVLYRTCSLDQLSKRFPNAEIHYLCSPMSAGLLRNNPHISCIKPYYSDERIAKVNSNNIHALKREMYDVAVITSTVQHFRNLILAIRLRAPSRIAFIHKGFAGFVTHPVPVNWPNSFPNLMWQLFSGGIQDSAPPQYFQPRIFPDSSDYEMSRQFLHTFKISNEDKPIALFAGSRQSIAMWSTKKYGELVDELQERGRRVVLFGSSSDKSLMDEIASNCKCPPNMCAGLLELRALYVVLQSFSCALCTDSGPRHIANAAGIKVFYFRNLHSFEIETGQYAESEYDLLPCGSLLTYEEQTKVLEKINPLSVAEAILESSRYIC